MNSPTKNRLTNIFIIVGSIIAFVGVAMVISDQSFSSSSALLMMAGFLLIMLGGFTAQNTQHLSPEKEGTKCSNSQKTKRIGTAFVVFACIFIFVGTLQLSSQIFGNTPALPVLLAGSALGIVGGQMRHRACVSQQSVGDAATKESS